MSLKKNMEMNDNIRFISGLDKSVYKHASNILTKYNITKEFGGWLTNYLPEDEVEELITKYEEERETI